jgi:hypothetical protein
MKISISSRLRRGKKYTNSSSKGTLSVKEQSQAQVADPALRHGTAETMEKAIARVMKIHGAILQKLAK